MNEPSSYSKEGSSWWAPLRKLAHSFILSQQNVTDVINQEKQCSKFVTIHCTRYFPKWLSLKIYENLYWIHFSLISFELVGLTLLRVYNKIPLNLLQYSWFQISVQCSFCEVYRTTFMLASGECSLHHITVTITIITNCTRFIKPHYIIVKIDLYRTMAAACWFLQRAQCSHCKRCISYGNSVRPSVRLSVRPSVTRQYCVKTMARSMVQFAPLDSKMCLVL